MKTLYLFPRYKKNSELCVPPSTASKRRCKHRPCGSFFAVFLIFVLFLASSCGGESPSPTPEADGARVTVIKEGALFNWSKFFSFGNRADISRITIEYTTSSSDNRIYEASVDTSSSTSDNFSISDSKYILTRDLTTGTTYYYLVSIYRNNSTTDKILDETLDATHDDKFSIPATPVPVVTKGLNAATINFSAVRRQENTTSITRITIEYTSSDISGGYKASIDTSKDTDFSTDASDYTLTRVTRNTTYYYRLTVYRSSDNGDDNRYNGLQSLATGDFTTKKLVSAKFGSAEFDFTQLDLTGITKITIDYTSSDISSGYEASVDFVTDFLLSAKTYTLSDLTFATTYRYRVRITRGEATEDVTGTFRTLVDGNGNGLIDISTPTQLHNMRYNPAGTSYKATSDTAVAGYTGGCPGGVCRGYELQKNLTFDKDEDGSTWSTSDFSLDRGDNAAPYFVVTSGGWEPIGTEGEPFNSIFEGNGYTITGLATSRADIINIGMFGAIGASAQIRRVGLVANLASYTGSVTDTVVGGLVGIQKGGIIIASYATGDANGGDEGLNAIGGLVGKQEGGGSITASYATGTANGGTGNSDKVGGLVGEQNNGSITASYATGPANVKSGNNNRMGGLVGKQEGGGSITASYATGTANGGANSIVGGLVGWQEVGGSITASYATGVPNGEDLVGRSKSAPPTDSYNFSVAEAKAILSTNLIVTSWNKDIWDFGTINQAPALQYADYDGDGSRFACGEAASTNGTISIPYCGSFLPGQDRTPVPDRTSLTPTAGASALLGSFALVDQDHDGYIDINNLGALRNIIHNPEGTSYKTSPASQGRTNGCPSNICQGYELTRNFSAAEVVSGGGLDHYLQSIITQDAIIKSNGYSIADLYLED